MRDPVIKIEKDIPLPTLRGSDKYHFGEMEVGDSFALPLSGQKTTSGMDATVGRLRSAMSYYGSRNQRKFCTRTMGDAVRVWRIL